jgi:phosphoribulokinase
MEPPNFKDTIAESPFIFTIGVAGDSGSGKTSFTRGIRSIFGDDMVSTITLDDYHSLDRIQRKELGVTPLDPRANRIDTLERDLFLLKRGIPIEKPVYNHETGVFDPPVIFRPKKILILEGLHTLFSPGLRSSLDFSLFVDPVKAVKYDWKIQRDVNKRGYSRETVIQEIKEREPEYEKYIAPQKMFADAVIGIDYSEYGEDLGHERNVYRVSLTQTRMLHSLQNTDLSIDLFSILSQLERNFTLGFGTSQNDGPRMGKLTIDGELSSHVVHKLEQSIEQQTKVHPISMFKHRKYVTAGDVIQLILSWRIIHQRIFLEERR